MDISVNELRLQWFLNAVAFIVLNQVQFLLIQVVWQRLWSKSDPMCLKQSVFLQIFNRLQERSWLSWEMDVVNIEYVEIVFVILAAALFSDWFLSLHWDLSAVWWCTWYWCCWPLFSRAGQTCVLQRALSRCEEFRLQWSQRWSGLGGRLPLSPDTVRNWLN